MAAAGEKEWERGKGKGKGIKGKEGRKRERERGERGKGEKWKEEKRKRGGKGRKGWKGWGEEEIVSESEGFYTPWREIPRGLQRVLFGTNHRCRQRISFFRVLSATWQVSAFFPFPFFFSFFFPFFFLFWEQEFFLLWRSGWLWGKIETLLPNRIQLFLQQLI